MRRTLLSASAAALLAGTAPDAAAAGDLAAGRDKALRCVACHGPEGVSEHEQWPNLAGQRPGYLRRQLQAFRAGTRSDPWMSPMAGDLSDGDIDDLAAYYSGL